MKSCLAWGTNCNTSSIGRVWRLIIDGRQFYTGWDNTQCFCPYKLGGCWQGETVIGGWLCQDVILPSYYFTIPQCNFTIPFSFSSQVSTHLLHTEIVIHNLIKSINMVIIYESLDGYQTCQIWLLKTTQELHLYLSQF